MRVLTPEQRRKRNEAKKRYRAKQKAKASEGRFAATMTVPPAEAAKIMATVPEPTAEPEEIDLCELHPAAVAVCLSLFFAKCYSEMPPRIPRTLVYDGCLFQADEHRVEGRVQGIRLTIKHNAYSGTPRSEILTFPYDAFRKVFLQA